MPTDPRPRLKRTLTAIVAVSIVIGLAPLVLAPSASAGVTPSCAAAGVGLAALGGPNFYIDSGSSPEFTSSYTGYTVTNSTGSAMTDTWVKLSGFTGVLGLGNGQAAAEQIASLDNGDSTPLFWYLTASGASASAQGYTVTVFQHNPGLPNATAPELRASVPPSR